MHKLKFRYISPILLLIIAALFFSSCSTTKVIPDGSYRLRYNKVVIENQLEFPEYTPADIQSYIRQKPNTYFLSGWSPALSIYNWSNGKNKGWDKFVRRLGQAPVILDTIMIPESIDNMNTHLNYIGYYNSTIKDSIVREKKKADVVYGVTLGKRYPIKEITYDIKDHMLKDIYIKDTLNSLIRKGVPLSERILDKESERATSNFKNQGYFDFTKNYFFFEADTLASKDSAILNIRIENYTRSEEKKDARPHRQFKIGNVYVYPVTDITRYRVALSNKRLQILDTLKYSNINILYDQKLKIRPSVLSRMNTVYPGATYSESVVNRTYQRYSSLRIYNSVSIEMNQKDTNTVDCNIRLIPSKVQGYKLNLEASTNSNGLMGMSPSISYYNRNIFRGGEWLNLSLMGSFQFDVKKPDEGDLPKRSNEFGVSAGVSFPTFLLLPDKIFKRIIPRTDVNFAYNYQERTEFTRNMISAAFGYSWNSVDRKFYYRTFPLQMSVVNMGKVSEEFIEDLKDPFTQDTYKSHFDFGGGFNVSYFSDPSINPKVSNLKTNLSVDIAGNLLSAFNKYMKEEKDSIGIGTGSRTIWNTPYSQYVRTELSLVYTWKFGKDNKQAVATRLLGGVGFAYGNSTTMPFERVFWAGGANSLRGWQARTVGPGSAPRDIIFAIPNQIGDMRLEANLEYRFPLFWLLHGAIFFDAGNVWNIKRGLVDQTEDEESYQRRILSEFGKDFYKQIALNTGVGLRLDMQVVVVRVDIGIKLYDPELQEWRPMNKWLKTTEDGYSGYAIQFGIGYPF